MKNPTFLDASKLSIGFVSPGWPLSSYPNGIVAYVQNIISGLESKSNTIVLANEFDGDKSIDGVVDLSKVKVTKHLLDSLFDKALFQLNFPIFKPLQYQKNIKNHALKLSIAIKQLQLPLDILEVEESFGLAYPLTQLSKIPVVTRIHGPWFLTGAANNIYQDQVFNKRVFFEGKAIACSHGITCPSADVLDKVREYYQIALPNAAVIPNPVPSVSKENQWQFDSKKTPSILFVGRFDYLKGADLVLNAFRIVALSHQDIELIFIGPDRGIFIDNQLLKFNDYLPRLIPEEAIRKRVKYMGHCESSVIAKLRKNTTLTVVSSRYETFSISLLEALAAGCPAIATSVGGMKEIIVNDYNGLFADPESPESIAEKIILLINNPEQMQRLSKNAITDCLQRFSPEVVAVQTLNYYKSVLSNQLR
jgi:glycosyltransferase involved in cell wall biosynthesis